MIVNSKIRDSDWLTFALTIVNFNYVFIQPAPGLTKSEMKDNLIKFKIPFARTITVQSSYFIRLLDVEHST